MRNPCKTALAVVAAMFLSMGVYAQNIVSGTVTDTGGEPLPGVSILLSDGAKGGTITDTDGRYKIDVGGGKIADIQLYRLYSPDS